MHGSQRRASTKHQTRDWSRGHAHYPVRSPGFHNSLFLHYFWRIRIADEASQIRHDLRLSQLIFFYPTASLRNDSDCGTASKARCPSSMPQFSIGGSHVRFSTGCRFWGIHLCVHRSRIFGGENGPILLVDAWVVLSLARHHAPFAAIPAVAGTLAFALPFLFPCQCSVYFFFVRGSDFVVSNKKKKKEFRVLRQRTLPLVAKSDLSRVGRSEKKRTGQDKINQMGEREGEAGTARNVSFP